MKIEWRNITDPYLHGITATVENRRAEVVRVDSYGRWHAFLYVDGKQPRDPNAKDTDYKTAKAKATAFLRGPKRKLSGNPKKFTRGDIDKFMRAYLATALWSSNDESDESGGEPMDKNYGIENFSLEALTQMKKDCDKFQRENWDDISSDVELAGHDFWLTRNGHGAGFWDGDWPKEVGERLTAKSKKFGEQNLYIGDDGYIYTA